MVMVAGGERVSFVKLNKKINSQRSVVVYLRVEKEIQKVDHH